MTARFARFTNFRTARTGLHIILLALLGLGILFAASRAGVAESPRSAAERASANAPVVHEPPRHWMYPRKTPKDDFVRKSEDRGLEWIRGDGY